MKRLFSCVCAVALTRDGFVVSDGLSRSLKHDRSHAKSDSLEADPIGGSPTARR
jgi:hypothetical protein